MSRARLYRTFAVLVLFAGFVTPARAIPSLPSVVSGSANIVVSGGIVNISSSHKAILNWDDFSIGDGETVNFLQASDSSAVLLRITGGAPSLINGSLRSNGRLFLTNSMGLVFAGGSLVEAGGLRVSTFDLTDTDFLAGNLNVQPSGSAGDIVVDGAIRVRPGGDLSLVSRGNLVIGGSIAATSGNVGLVGGNLSLPAAASDHPAAIIHLPTAASDRSVGTISLLGGSLSPLAGSIVLLGGEGTINVLTVPEPRSLPLLVAGLGLMGIVLHRQGRAKR